MIQCLYNKFWMLYTAKPTYHRARWVNNDLNRHGDGRDDLFHLARYRCVMKLMISIRSATLLVADRMMRNPCTFMNHHNRVPKEVQDNRHQDMPSWTENMHNGLGGHEMRMSQDELNLRPVQGPRQLIPRATGNPSSRRITNTESERVDNCSVDEDRWHREGLQFPETSS